jgi:uncharacterized protein (DUF58 family)
MIVPTSRMLWVVGLVVCPALTLAGVQADSIIVAIGAIALVATVAAIDALRGLDLLRPLIAELPSVVRLVKGRPGFLPLRLRHEHCRVRNLRLGLGLPNGLQSDQDSLQAHIPDSPASRFDWPVAAPERGHYNLLTCHAETPSPLGLWLHRRILPVQCQVRVQPDLATAIQSNAAFLARALNGVRSLRQIGRGRDFEKLRDYIPGDSVDDIHWRATAKRGHPVTKIFQVERTQEVYVLVDASRLSGRILATEPDESSSRRAEPLLEQFIQAALILGAVAERQGDLFGLLTFASQVESFVRADSGSGHFGTCREKLVTLQTQAVTPDFEELASFLRVRLRRRALLLFLTSLDDPVAAEGFVRAIEILRHQHLCVVVQPRAPGVEAVFTHDQVQTVDHLHQALAGHLHWRGLRELQSVLQRRGVTVALASAEGLAGALVSRYLDVKRRQAL